jgi:hypothetical protein
VQEVIEQRLIAAGIQIGLHAAEVGYILHARRRNGRYKEPPRRPADRHEVVRVAQDRDVEKAIGLIDAAALWFDRQLTLGDESKKRIAVLMIANEQRLISRQPQQRFQMRIEVADDVLRVGHLHGVAA